MASNLLLKEGPPESVGMDPVRVNRLRELCSRWVKTGNTPSLSVLVARRGMIVLHEAFGVRRPEDRTPTLQLNSLTPIASATKAFTATLIMSLVEDGLIGLNRPFVEYVPELDVPGVQWLEEARVADLLCHTSGLEDLAVAAHMAAADRKSADFPAPGEGQHPAINRRIRLAAGVPLARRPGTAMVYSNFGFQLLGDIVRRVSGQSLWQFSRERLFDPLGMNDTSYVLPEQLRNRRVYRAPGMPWIPPVPGLHSGGDSAEYDEIDMGHGGITSTARDLSVFLQMLLNRGSYGGRRILSPATVNAMTRPQIDGALPKLVTWVDLATGKFMEREIKGGDFGYGLFIQGHGDTFVVNGSLCSPLAFGHSGLGGTYLWADPGHDLLVVFLAVAPRLYRGIAPIADSDLFMNAVYGAIVD
jgi:CubicO group peptidase (beta-lactamase class C family)